jgi:hypothetical protein
MRRRTIVGAVAAVAAATVAVSAGIAAGSDGSHLHGDHLAEIRDATAGYRKVERAVDAGYTQFFGCIHEPLAGSMGVHFVNGALAGDAVVEAGAPEALMYEVLANGKLALLGVEYVVFQSAWDAEHGEPPTLFGETFNLVTEPNRYGIPAFYELHAWAWKDNPTGAHEDWNPQVICTTPDR